MSTYIPFDIQVQIIERLPVKSLIRFISVCKAWKSFIDCSEFVAGYRVLPTQPEHLMIRYEVGDWPETIKVKFICFVDDDTFPHQKFVPTVPPLVQLLDQSRIIDSSCGLLCLDGFFREPDNSRTDVVVLWNPLIRKSIAVAVPNVEHRPFNYVIGFGVCPDTNDPKLVKITYIDEWQKIESISCIPCQVMVFTLSSGEWTTSCSNQLPRKSIQFENAFQTETVIGQFIYWVAYDRTDEDGRCRYHNLIMSFDLSTEEFREVDLPDSLTDMEPEKCLFISRLKDSLAVVEYDADFPWKRACVVWMMEHGDLKKSFRKLFAIESPHASITWTLGFRRSGEPIFEMEVDHLQDPHQGYRRSGEPSRPLVGVYEPCSDHIKDLGICGNIYSFYGSFYTESLLLLDHDDGRIVRFGAVKR